MKTLINGTGYDLNTIYLFNRKTGESVEIGTTFIFKHKNIFGETYESETQYINAINLKDPVTNKRKIDLHNKNSFIVKSLDHSRYYTYFDLYIEINNNNIIIEELPETKKEMNQGEFWVSKNYKISLNNTANIKYNEYKTVFATEEEFKNLSFSKQQDFKTFENEIKELSEDNERTRFLIKLHPDYEERTQKRIAFYQQKIDSGIYGFYSVSAETTESTEFKVSKHARIEHTQDRVLFEQFEKQFKKDLRLENEYINEDDLRKTLKKYGIDYTKNYNK